MLTGRVLGAALAALWLTADLTAAQAPPPAGTGFIVGQVVDGAGGGPIAGATVTLIGPTPGPLVLTTSDGYFLFRNLAPGRYHVSASKSGFGTGSAGQLRPDGPSRQILLDNAQGVLSAPVRLWRLGAITGRVVDERDEPQVGVPVRALTRRVVSGTRRFEYAGATLTDDRGMYRLSSLVPGSYLVSVGARRVGETRDIGTVSGEGPVLTLTGPSRADGDGTAGAAADVVPRAIADVPMYRETFSPDAPSSTQAQPVTVLPGQDAAGVDVRVAETTAYAVAGTVIGPDGPAPGVNVRLFQRAAGEPLPAAPFADIQTNDRGGFAFPAVPEGVYELLATTQGAPGPDAASSAPALWGMLPLAVHETLPGLQVPLREGFTIRGRIELEGADQDANLGDRQAPIVIAPADPHPALAPIAVRPDGRGYFTSPSLLPGRYFVTPAQLPASWHFRATYHAGLDVSDEPLVLDVADVNDLAVTMTRTWTGVRGSVLTAAGQPDAAALVVLFPMNPQAWEGSDYSPRRIRSISVTPGGGFQVDDLPPGSYYVIAIPDAAAGGWDDPDVLLGLTRDATQIAITSTNGVDVVLRTRPVR